MLAYYDSHYGLVPAKITHVCCNGARFEVYATITANKPRGGYKRGMKIVTTPLWIFPRRYVVKNKLHSYNPILEYAGLIKERAEE